MNEYLNRRIGNYLITSKIGDGGFASVYLAQHYIIKGRLAAIKFLHPHLLSEQEKERFIMEAETLEMLKHPHILHLYDTGIDDEGSPYIITEYAAQGSLRARLRKRPHHPLPLTEAETIIIQIGQALHYAHQHKIIHRDLKPENILFNAEGKVLLADFGLAVVLEKNDVVGITGTPAYMAPEQFRGQVSPKSDIYALACIAYEMLTGYHPFSEPSQRNWWTWQDIHQEEIPPMPQRYNHHLPLRLTQHINVALSKSPHMRHSDVLVFTLSFHETKEQWLREGKDHLRENRYEEALAAYNHVLELDSNSADAYLGKAIVLHGLKRYEEALEAIERTIQLAPGRATAYYRKGEIIYQQDLHRCKEALAAFEKTVELMPNFAGGHAYRGLMLWILGRYEEAIQSYGQVIQLNPTDANAYVNRANALNDLKRHEEALTDIEQSLRLRPDDVSTYNTKGNTLRTLRRYEEALAAYEQALRIDPYYFHAVSNMSNVLRDLKRYEESLEACERAIPLASSHVTPPYSSKGLTLFALKRYEEALATYNHALILEPNNGYAHSKKGEVLIALKRYEEAVSAFEHANLLQPTHTIAFLYKGKALWLLKRYKEALSALDEALRLDPNDYAAHSWRGAALYNLGEYEEALVSRERALAINPNEAIDHTGKGQVLLKLQRYEEALAALEQALRLNPEDPHAQRGRETALEQLGQHAIE